MCINCNKEEKIECTKHLFQSNKVLNAYKLNILIVVTFNKANQTRFQKPSHFHPTRFWELNFVQPVHDTETRKYLISIGRS